MRWGAAGAYELPAGLRIHTPVSQLDVVRTVAALAGVSVPRTQCLDGLDLSALVRSGGAPASRRRRVFLHSSSMSSTGLEGAGHAIVVRAGAWKLISKRKDTCGSACEPRKFVQSPARCLDSYALYHLELDPALE